ncbi:MAG: hypothetical protein MIO93_10305 [ANME-2 cluster archaeon]|jgi:hypothetical protein|nr:hypothetical protein [ANME-2 cluster archaeon]
MNILDAMIISPVWLIVIKRRKLYTTDIDRREKHILYFWNGDMRLKRISANNPNIMLIGTINNPDRKIMVPRSLLDETIRP